jgi:hypothetical protein
MRIVELPPKMINTILVLYKPECYSLPQTWVFLNIHASDAVLTLKPTTTIFEALRALLLKIQVFRNNIPFKLLNNISNRI